MIRAYVKTEHELKPRRRLAGGSPAAAAESRYHNLENTVGHRRGGSGQRRHRRHAASVSLLADSDRLSRCSSWPSATPGHQRSEAAAAACDTRPPGRRRDSDAIVHRPRRTTSAATPAAAALEPPALRAAVAGSRDGPAAVPPLQELPAAAPQVTVELKAGGNRHGNPDRHGVQGRRPRARSRSTAPM